jgi:hypothetical protein
VPASEKLVSLFEPHVDIIVKGGRQVQYGHKLYLATGKSGLILDIVIETANPADPERFVSMLELQAMAAGLAAATEMGTERWRAEVAHYLPLIARVIFQTRRRGASRLASLAAISSR